MPSLHLPILELGPWRLVHWALILASLTAAVWVAFADQHRRPWGDYALGWWLWHWYTGGHLESGRELPHEGGLAPYLSRRAGVAAARTALAAALAAGEYLRSGAAHGTAPAVVAAWGLGGAVALSAALVAITHVAVKAALWFQWVRPLHRAVWKAAGWSEHKRPGRYITLRRNRERAQVPTWRRRLPGRLGSSGARGDGVVVKLAPTANIQDLHKQRVEQIVKAKLALEDVSHTWVTAGRHCYVQFRRLDPVPELVRFLDPAVLDLVAAAKSSSVLLGLTRAGRPVWISLDTDSPHILVSAATGGGKSNILATIAAQLMWHGADVTVLDYKRHSHRWLRDLAGVRYARDIGEIHRALIQLAAEGERRNRAWDDVPLTEQGPIFRRHLVLCEELSSTMDELRQWWRDNRKTVWDGDGPPPDTSPAVRALAHILNMGRAVRINVLAVAQMATAQAMGSGAMRENYSVRILAGRYSHNTWKMLVPDCPYSPATGQAGRVQMCIGSTATETQVLLTDEMALAGWVLDKRGAQVKGSATVTVSPDSAHLGEWAVTRHGTVTPVGANGVEPVTLWEASSDKGRGVLAMTYETLRQARHRAKGEFPSPAGMRGDVPEYDPIALQRWELNRPQGGRYVGNETNEVGRMEPREKGEVAEDDWSNIYPQADRDSRDMDRDRFLAKVQRSAEDGCSLWTGAVDGDGYGQFSVEGRTVKAHRFAYEQWVGPIPEGETLDHTCETPACVRPDHLQPVTASRNTQLRHERQRAREGAQT